MNFHNVIKKILLQGGLLCAALPALAQTPTATMNYIEARSPRTQIRSQANLDTKTAVPDSVATAVQYMDGLGRPVQTVQYQASPLKKDVVQPVAYDAYGREAIKYLPYTATSNNGSYKTDALTTGAGVFLFYKPAGVSTPQQTNGIVVTADPFSVTGFEPSPLNRVVEQGAPGENFQLTPGTGDPNSSNHTAKVVYSTNDVVAFVPGTVTNNPGDHMVALYTASVNPNQSRTLARLNNNAYYSAGQLELTIAKNENWKPGDGCIGITEEYKDKEGHMVLRRTYDKATATSLEELSTYYVYDDLGNLCFVLPPGTQPDGNVALTSAQLDGYCYQYRYDGRNRLTQKKLPGKGWEFTVYNTLGQVVMAQTGNQRNMTPQQWTFNKYDAQGRVIVTGIYTYPGSTLDANVDAPAQTEFLALTAIFAGATYPLWEAPNSTTTTGYDGLSYPTGQAYTLLSANYYDNYTNIPSLPANYNKASTHSSMTTGLLTASKTYVFNSTDALWSVNYYNDLGLPNRTFKEHYLGGTSSYSRFNYDSDTLAYNFNKQPVFIQHVHYVSNAGTSATIALTTNDTYTYDQMGRKLVSYQQIKDHAGAFQAKTIIAQTGYNEIGQLRTKSLNSLSPYTTFLQNINYRYTARGWLSSINNANLTPDGGVTSSDSNDLFGEELSYDSPPTNSTPQYNGNISYVKWKSGTPAGQAAQNQQAYDYRYDPLNRVINAMSSTAGSRNNLYNEYVRYNRMGDITTLGRYDQSLGSSPATLVQIDSLTYTNLYYTLQKVTNTASTQLCDACFIDGVNLSVEYQYDIDGNLTQDKNKSISKITYNLLNLPQTITFNNGNTVVYIYDAAGTKLRKISTISGTVTTTDYIDGIEYDNSTTTLAFVQTEEGKARLSGTTYTYEYDLKDHLGDTRVTFNADVNGNPQVLQLANYYPFGANIGSLAFVSGIKNHYLYNHKELQDETELYDYGARFYDPVISRWTTIDPLAEKSRRWSPYNYGENNPIKNIDPDGMEIVGTDGKAVTYSVNKNGTVTWSKNASADVKTYGNALLSVGSKGSLDAVIHNDIKTSIVISSADNETSTSATYGNTTQGDNNAGDNYGKVANSDGTYGIKDATITIYTGSIDNAIKDGSGSKLEGLTKTQAIGAVATHENVHASNKKEISKDVKYELNHNNSPRPDKEAKANQAEQKVIDAQKQKNQQQQQ